MHVHVEARRRAEPWSTDLDARLAAALLELEAGRTSRARARLEDELERSRWRYLHALEHTPAPLEPLLSDQTPREDHELLVESLVGHLQGNRGVALPPDRGLPLDCADPTRAAWLAAGSPAVTSWALLTELRTARWWRQPDGAPEPVEQDPPALLARLAAAAPEGHELRLVHWAVWS